MARLFLHRRLWIGDYKRRAAKVWYGSQHKKFQHLISDNCIASHAPTEQKERYDALNLNCARCEFGLKLPDPLLCLAPLHPPLFNLTVTIVINNKPYAVITLG